VSLNYVQPAFTGMQIPVSTLAGALQPASLFVAHSDHGLEEHRAREDEHQRNHDQPQPGVPRQERRIRVTDTLAQSEEPQRQPRDYLAPAQLLCLTNRPVARGAKEHAATHDPYNAESGQTARYEGGTPICDNEEGIHPVQNLGSIAHSVKCDSRLAGVLWESRRVRRTTAP
jgi:hypothetical protein